jgi:hypothetical protein
LALTAALVLGACNSNTPPSVEVKPVDAGVGSSTGVHTFSAEVNTTVTSNLNLPMGSMNMQGMRVAYMFDKNGTVTSRMDTPERLFPDQQPRTLIAIIPNPKVNGTKTPTAQAQRPSFQVLFTRTMQLDPLMATMGEALQGAVTQGVMAQTGTDGSSLSLFNPNAPFAKQTVAEFKANASREGFQLKSEASDEVVVERQQSQDGIMSTATFFFDVTLGAIKRSEQKSDTPVLVSSTITTIEYANVQNANHLVVPFRMNTATESQMKQANAFSAQAMSNLSPKVQAQYSQYAQMMSTIAAQGHDVTKPIHVESVLAFSSIGINSVQPSFFAIGGAK